MFKIFFDSEFTGLHQNTTLISIGLVSENGKTFYAEFTDYDAKQLDDWITQNVMNNLLLGAFDMEKDYNPKDKNVIIKGDTKTVQEALSKWLNQFGEVEMWSDCLSYDWVLFNQLWGHAFNIPKNVFYIPFDLCTVFKLKGINPDISREKFIGDALPKTKLKKHNALWDALIIRECYYKVMYLNELD